MLLGIFVIFNHVFTIFSPFTTILRHFAKTIFYFFDFLKFFEKFRENWEKSSWWCFDGSLGGWIVFVGDYSDHAGLAGWADEAVVVPVPALEGDESCTADPCKPVSKRKQNLTVQRSVWIWRQEMYVSTIITSAPATNYYYYFKDCSFRVSIYSCLKIHLMPTYFFQLCAGR